MLLRVNGLELEIVEDKFVCFSINDGENSHFCEWKYLDPKLRERFTILRQEFLNSMNEFAHSDTRAVFQSIAEEYGQDSEEAEGAPVVSSLEKPPADS